MNKNFEPHTSSLGIDANIIMLIAYFGGILVSFIPVINALAWTVPLIIFFLEKDSKYVKFHALQSLFLEILGLIIAIIVGLLLAISAASALLSGSLNMLGIAGITSLVSLIASVIMFIFSIVAAIKGWNYQCYKIPLIGAWSEKIALK